MPDKPGAIPVSCGDCGAHFQLDPGGDVAGAACSECGGTRFFRSQPSPTQSDGALRDMVDMQAGGVDRGGSPNTEGTIMASVPQNCPICGTPNGECPHTTFAPHSDTLGIDTRPLPQQTPGNPLAEGSIMGEDGEKSRGFRDNYMHSKVASPNFQEIVQLRQGLSPEMQRQVDDLYLHNGEHAALDFLRQIGPRAPARNEGSPIWDTLNDTNVYGNTGGKRVEPMRTFNMEPYAPLWDESYIPAKTGGFAAPLVEGAGALMTRALPTLMKGALGRGVGMGLAEGMMGGDGGGQQAGGMAPEQPDPAPGIQQLSSADIPFLLMGSGGAENVHGEVPSVDEQHDDPEKQDQKEFNDGDKSPSNMNNPNNQDTGVDGEDGVRDATDGYGIGPNSPSVERAMMILPLLMHYFQSDDSGQTDPLIRALHDALEQESPGYLDNEDPEGHKYVELVIQNHGQKPPPQGVTSGVNAFTGELGSGMGGPGGTPATSGGTCPVCGGVLAGDGSCPQCGSKQHPQGGMDMGTATGIGAGMSSGGASYPPNRVGNSQGPVTPEQKDAIKQAIDTMPWLFGDVLNEIQNQPNTPPLVDPSQAQPTPAPMPGMMNAPGAMPMPDPTQAGGGMGMPMQPMARVAVGPETFRSLPTDSQGWHDWDPYELPNDMFATGECPQCHSKSFTQSGGKCLDCGYMVGDEGPGTMDTMTDYDPNGGGVLHHHNDLQNMQPHWGKTADANNNVPRCPKCNTATTTVMDGLDGDGERKGRCHSCGEIFDLNNKKSQVVLTDLVNPIYQNAAERQEKRPGGNQDSTLTWQDSSGQPLIEGATYELHTPGYQVPEEVQVVGPPKPDQVHLKMVGNPAGIPGVDDSTPDFSISPHEMQMYKYEFVPTSEPDNPDENQATPLGGMPGLEQIPQQPQTTDEVSTSYPNKGTMAAVLASEEPEYDDLCHKCGCDWITHTASSSTTVMHECSRCGTAWESQDKWDGRHSNVDLSWIREDSGDNDFHSEMERAQAMRNMSGQSRNITAVAAKDERLQGVRDLLSRNKSERERTAGRHFTPSEQRALVNERGTARNLEDLDLTNTHYRTSYDPTGKANGLNAPDAHLILGI